MSEWISVDSLIPDHTGYVLCFGECEGASVFFGCFEFGKWFGQNNGDYADGGYGNDYDASVTHWMELPEPPK